MGKRKSSGGGGTGCDGGSGGSCDGSGGGDGVGSGNEDDWSIDPPTPVVSYSEDDIDLFQRIVAQTLAFEQTARRRRFRYPLIDHNLACCYQ